MRSRCSRGTAETCHTSLGEMCSAARRRRTTPEIAREMTRDRARDDPRSFAMPGGTSPAPPPTRKAAARTGRRESFTAPLFTPPAVNRQPHALGRRDVARHSAALPQPAPAHLQPGGTLRQPGRGVRAGAAGRAAAGRARGRQPAAAAVRCPEAHSPRHQGAALRALRAGRGRSLGRGGAADRDQARVCQGGAGRAGGGVA